MISIYKIPSADAPVPKSLLKIVTEGSSDENKSKRRVKFTEGRHVCYFEIENPDKKLIKPSHDLLRESLLSARAAEQTKNQKQSHQNIVKPQINFNELPHQNIINDVTLWNCSWMRCDPEIVKVNGDTVLLPIMQVFRSLEDYERVLIPLMKIELWISIRNSDSPSVRMEQRAIVRHMVHAVPRGNGYRNIYSCMRK